MRSRVWISESMTFAPPPIHLLLASLSPARIQLQRQPRRSRLCFLRGAWRAAATVPSALLPLLPSSPPRFSSSSPSRCCPTHSPFVSGRISDRVSSHLLPSFLPPFTSLFVFCRTYPPHSKAAMAKKGVKMNLADFNGPQQSDLPSGTKHTQRSTRDSAAHSPANRRADMQQPRFTADTSHERVD